MGEEGSRRGRGAGARVGRVLPKALVGMCVALGLYGLIGSSALAATTITVTSTADTLGSGMADQCTLRDALVLANDTSNSALTGSAEPGGSAASSFCVGDVSGSGSPYTILLQGPQTYTLDTVDNYWFGPDGLPPISTAVTIDGDGATITRAASAPAFRFFYVSGGLSGIPAGSLTLHDLTLSDGWAEGGGSQEASGGGAGMGGAIFDQGTLALEQVTLSDNLAQGGSPNCGTACGSGGGGIGGWVTTGTDTGGGFGGSAPGEDASSGGIPGSDGAGAGGGGFQPGDTGGSSPSSTPGAGGGQGGFGSGSGDGGDGGAPGQGGAPSGGDGGGFGAGGLTGDGAGGGGVGGGGGYTPTGSGGGGGFGGGGGGGGNAHTADAALQEPPVRTPAAVLGWAERCSRCSAR
jgi:CSLREA domain-containing protein